MDAEPPTLSHSHPRSWSVCHSVNVSNKSIRDLRAIIDHDLEFYALGRNNMLFFASHVHYIEQTVYIFSINLLKPKYTIMILWNVSWLVQLIALRRSPIGPLKQVMEVCNTMYFFSIDEMNLKILS